MGWGSHPEAQPGKVFFQLVQVVGRTHFLVAEGFMAAAPSPPAGKPLQFANSTFATLYWLETSHRTREGQAGG